AAFDDAIAELDTLSWES
nr:puromycin-sensitive aminopeptidase isozyme I, PSA-I {peptide SI-19} {EC 3.4.11.-} [chickens, brain, Peptide Partial, 17 aa] [Gallus gallus]